jgi:hypothetical protein
MSDTAPTAAQADLAEPGQYDPFTGGIDLPPGVHPFDPSVAVGPGGTMPTDNAAPHDTAGDRWTAGRKGFGTDNAAALATFQRASEFWSARVVSVDANSGGTAQVVGRQRGRTNVTIWVPSLLPNGATPLGVILAPTEGEAQAGGNSGIVLLPGDSLTITTEAPVFAGLIPGNASGYCQCVVTFDPPVPVSVDY